MHPTAKLIYDFGPFRLDTSERILFRDGQYVPLMPKAFETLLALVERHGHIVEKEELMQKVWPDAFVEEVNLFKNISDLRKILGGDGAKQYIETIPKRGYRFIAEVRELWEAGGVSGRSTVTSARGDPEPTCGVALPGELIGREAELAQLQSRLETALRGERQIVFVTGEPGIGKTTLVKSFLQRVSANRRLWIAHGQCLEQYGTGEAYLPVLEAFSRLCCEPGREQLIALLGQRAPTWLAQMPALASVVDRAVLHRETLGATRERMLREMTDTIEAASTEMPLVFVIEDLHWSDYSTLDLVSALAQRRGPARLLLVGTWRPVEVNLSGHPLKAVKQELQMRRCCTELPLGFLTEAAVSEYIEARLPQHLLPEDLARLIHQRTDGNPLFMVNLVDYLLAQGVIVERAGKWRLNAALTEIEVAVPDSIRQMIERQIDRLSNDEQRILEAASVAGVEFSAATVAGAVDVDMAQIEEQCERLAHSHHFLRSAGISQWPDGTEASSYGFIHALYQDVFYQRVTAARRRQLHRRIGEIKESAYGPRSTEIAAELWMHFEQGREYRQAIQYLQQAAENALRCYANREAVSYLLRALELVKQLPASEHPRLQLVMLERLGSAYRSMDDLPEAINVYEAMLACARKEGQVEDEVSALLCLNTGLYWTDPRRCLEISDGIIELIPRVQDKLLKILARGYCGHWNLCLRDWRYEDFLAVVATVEAAREADDRAQLGVFQALTCMHQCRRSEYQLACRAADEGLQLTQEAGEAYAFMTCQYFLAWALLHLGEWNEMLRIIRAGFEIAEKNCSQLLTIFFQLHLAWLHEQAFDFERAREICESVYPHLRAGQFQHLWGSALLGFAHLGLERYEVAFDCFDEITHQLKGDFVIMDRILYLLLHHGLSRCWLERREFARAHNEAEKVCQLAAQSGERTYLALGRQTLAEIALAQEDYAKAEAELSHAINAIQNGDTPLAEWRVWQTAARLHAANGRQAEADHDWAHSLAILNRLADSLGQEEPLRQKILGHVSTQEMIHYIQTQSCPTCISLMGVGLAGRHH